MAGSTANPRIWTNGDVYSAVLGSTAPTDVSTALAAAWKALGLLGENGASMSRDMDSNQHYAWGGILVRTTRTKYHFQLKVTCLEDNNVVWPLVNPGSTAVTATLITTRTVKIPTSDIRAFIVQIQDGTTITRRLIPRGEIVEVGEVTFADSDMTGYELTIDVYPDSTTSVAYIDITNDTQAIVP